MFYEFANLDMHTKYYVLTIIMTLVVATFHKLETNTTNGFAYAMSAIVLNPLTKAITLLLWVISIAMMLQ
ncbi:hypothetical protein [Enterobacter hormaechei]|uniref:hypothetical protein n=1 Tax=Enterobacter hormaechei TaxID=158836 RepID=UPI0023AFC63F|nr:hypothetical protein [Enterobacter hormaechei]MDE7845088.1 hypothetical protein [Enterobacter hormaechei]